MIKTNFYKSRIFTKSLFTLAISSSNIETLNNADIFGYPMSLNIEALPIDNLQCVLIDKKFFSKFNFEPFLDDNGVQEDIEIYNENDEILARQKVFELLIYYNENNELLIKKTRCVYFDNIYIDFGVNIIFGKGSVLI